MVHAHGSAGLSAPEQRLAPLLLSELEKSHRLIVLLLNQLPDAAARARFALQSEREGLGTEGATRHHERAQLIEQAKAELA